MRGANSRAQKSRTVATSCSWSGVRARPSTRLTYFVGEGVAQTAGVGLVFGVGLAFGGGEGQVTGLAVGSGFRSFGPTWPMNGRCLRMLRVKGTVLELCS